MNLLKSLLFLAFLPSLVLSQEPLQTAKTDPSKIEANLAPDKTTVMPGEPIHMSLIVKNKSDRDLHVIVGSNDHNYSGRTVFTAKVTDQDKKNLPVRTTSPCMEGIAGLQKISSSGTYVFRLFLPDVVTFEKPGHYTIDVTKILQLSGSGENWENTTDIPVRAAVDIDVIPLDREKLGHVIDELGKKMLEGNFLTRREQVDELTAIQDERVIPYFRRALNTGDASMRIAALEALSHFNNDAALDGLKEGMKTTANDLGYFNSKAAAADQADSVRHFAAMYLSESPHPGAIPFLLTQIHDSSKNVRIRIVQTVGSKTSPQVARPILEEMSRGRRPNSLCRSHAIFESTKIKESPRTAPARPVTRHPLYQDFRICCKALI